MSRKKAMTREEAITKLVAYAFWASEHVPDEVAQALDMAIEALKAETKKCPICGSDLYEYCFMCCYEGEKVTRSETGN